VGRGQFPELVDRDDLWRLLVTITTRKVVESVRRETRKKRGGGRVRGDSAFMEGDEIDQGMAQVLSREPDPEVAAEFAEDYERLINKLDDPALQAVALRKLEGHSTEEIAAKLGTSRRTIDRKLTLIRRIWQEELAS